MDKAWEARFWDKVETGPGCWTWRGAKSSDGYGYMRVNGRMILAHRFSIFLRLGTIDPTLMACHHCDNKLCVNPDHLYLGTAADNNRDRDERGFNGHANKTHCPNGHVYDEDNTYVFPSGKHRQCIACRRISHAKRKAAVA